MQRWEVVCRKKHQFGTMLEPGTAQWDKLKCPTCGSGLIGDVMFALPDAPFEHITDGWELWRDSIEALVDGCRVLDGLWQADRAADMLQWLYAMTIGQATWNWLMGAGAGVSPELVVIGWEDLRCELSIDQKADAAVEMADLTVELSNVKDRKKVAVAEFNAEIERIQDELTQIGESVHSGQRRRVTIHTIHNYRNGTVSRVRTDTGVVLSERAMTADERQSQFVFRPKSAATASTSESETPTDEPDSEEAAETEATTAGDKADDQVEEHDDDDTNDEDELGGEA